MNASAARGFVVMLMFAVAGCESLRGPPVLRPELYAFETQVRVDPEVPDLLAPDVVRGKGRGAVDGAGKGVSGCLRHGADQGDAGLVLMLLLSPVCALVGGAVGAGRAESSSNVDVRTLRAEEQMRIFAARDTMARLLAQALGPVAVFDRDAQRLQPEAPASGGVYRRARLTLTIGDIGLVGKGIDPPLNLAMVMHVCVRDADSGEEVLSQRLQVPGPAHKLEHWAEQGAEAWDRDAADLASAAMTQVGRFLKRATARDSIMACPEPADE
jgi:hypothetical protein